MEPTIPPQPPTPIPTVSSQPPPTPLTPAKPKSSLLTGVIVIILLLFLAAGGFLVYQNRQLKQQMSHVQQTPTPLITPTTTPDPTANWKTYTDSNNSFFFKYPPEFESDNCGISGPAKEGAMNLICLGDPKTIAQGTDKPFDGFAVYTQSLGQQNFQTYIENEKKFQFGWKSAMGNGQTTTGKESTLTVTGKEATVLNNYSWDTIERIYIEMPNNMVLIIAKLEESKGSFSAFDQILSTFKFTN